MPIYEFECQTCKKTTEIMQKMADPPLRKCSHCQVEADMRKIMCPTAFVLKGGGWYTDAYSSKAPKKEGTTSEKSDTPSSDSAAKPAAAPAASESAAKPAASTSDTVAKSK